MNEAEQQRYEISKALNLKGILGEEIAPLPFILAEIERLTAENKAQAERIAELEKRPDFTKGGHDISEFYQDEEEQP